MRPDHTKTSRSQVKKIAEVAQSFMKKVFDDSVLKQRKLQELDEKRDDAVKKAVHTAVDELTKPGDYINEQKIR